jgi:hypothetical protein
MRGSLTPKISVNLSPELVADFYFFFALRIVECLNGFGLHSFNLTMFVDLVEWPLWVNSSLSLLYHLGGWLRPEAACHGLKRIDPMAPAEK